MLESGWRNITVQLPTKPPVFMASEEVKYFDNLTQFPFLTAHQFFIFPHSSYYRINLSLPFIQCRNVMISRRGQGRNLLLSRTKAITVLHVGV